MTSYVAAGYIAVFGTLSLYAVSLILRARQAASKVTTVERFLHERGSDMSANRTANSDTATLDHQK
jgi:hypothetical protein